MARNYWINGATTAADGESLDAWTARTRMIGNVEAVYEEARIDQCIILQAPVSASARLLTLMGPLPIVMRYDRGGGWRTPYFSLLCCGGTGTPTLRVVLTDQYRFPRGNLLTGATETIEPYTDTEPGAGTTVAWQEAKAITIPSWWAPHVHDEPGGSDETGRTHIAWASVWIVTEPVTTYASVAGLRWYESITEEPA